MRAVIVIAALGACHSHLEPVSVTVPYNTTVGVFTDRPFDPDAAYQWRLERRPGDSLAVLENPRSPTPTFDADVVGTYEVALYEGVGPSVAEVYRIRYEAINVAPTFDEIVAPSIVVDTEPFAVRARASDANSDEIEISVTLVGPPGADTSPLLDEALPGDHAARFDPDVIGDYELTVVATDALGATIEVKRSLTIIPEAIPITPRSIGAPVFSHSRDTLAVAGDGLISIFRAGSGELVEISSFADAGQSLRLGPSDDGRYVVVNNPDGSQLRVLDLDVADWLTPVIDLAARTPIKIGEHLYYLEPGAVNLRRLGLVTMQSELVSERQGFPAVVPARRRLYLTNGFREATAFDLARDPPVELWTVSDVVEPQFFSVDGSRVANAAGSFWKFGDTAETDLSRAGAVSGGGSWIDHSAARGQIVVVGRLDDETIRLHDDTTYAEVATLPTPLLGGMRPTPIAAWFASSNEELIVLLRLRLDGVSVFGVGWLPLDNP